jgi:hypothetical protein
MTYLAETPPAAGRVTTQSCLSKGGSELRVSAVVRLCTIDLLELGGEDLSCPEEELGFRGQLSRPALEL